MVAISGLNHFRDRPAAAGFVSHAAGRFLFTMMHLELHQINNRMYGLRTCFCDGTEISVTDFDNSDDFQRGPLPAIQHIVRL